MALVRRDLPQDPFYTEARVKHLLRLYPYLQDAKPPKDPDMQPAIRKAFGPGGWQEEAAVRRADIYRALVWLEERDPHRGWQVVYALRAYYAVQLPQSQVVKYLRGQGVHISQATVSRWCKDSIPLLAAFLSGQIDTDEVAR